jgi:hypothetical protein
MIHYIFLDIGLQGLEKRSDFLDNINHNKVLYPNYKIWNDDDIKNLIDTEYPEIKNRLYKMPYYYLVDIGRALILNKNDGFYCDMDIRINKLLPEDIDVLHSSYIYPSGKKILGNSLLKLPKDLYYPFIIYCLDEYDRLDKIDVYKTWKYRKLLQSVGGASLKRFCIKNKLKLDFNYYDYCDEDNTACILKVASNKKGYGK